MSQLLFTAFSNRIDAIELAREAALRLEGAGIASSMYLLDSDVAPVITEATLVVSLGGDGTFLEAARLAHQFGARVLAVNLGRLGFLLNVPPSELVDDINHSLAHDHVADRLALTITFSSGSAAKSSSRPFAAAIGALTAKAATSRRCWRLRRGMPITALILTLPRRSNESTTSSTARSSIFNNPRRT